MCCAGYILRALLPSAAHHHYRGDRTGRGRSPLQEPDYTVVWVISAVSTSMAIVNTASSSGGATPPVLLLLLI